MRKLLTFILVCAIMMTVFTGCTSVKEDSANNDELNPTSSVTMGEDEANNLKDKTPVQLYFVNEQGTKLTPEMRYINNTETSKGKEHLATIVLKELISGPAKGSLLQTYIPKETTVKSDVTIKDGIATVNLSKEFIDKHPSGKKKEQLTLYSIVNTLTEISEIKSVQFKIDGKVKKEFKGSYQIDVAFPRSAYLITSKPADINNKVDSKKENIKQPAKEESKDQIKQESKEQIKEESKDQIKQESKEQIKEESKDKIKEDSKDQIKQDSKDQIKEDTKGQMKEDTSKDKKTSSESYDDLDDIETNAEILE